MSDVTNTEAIKADQAEVVAQKKQDRAPFVRTEEFGEAKYHGRCFCGNVTFEISGEALQAMYCHCTVSEDAMYG